MKKWFVSGVLIILLLGCKQQNDREVKLQGNALGTTFHITYLDDAHRDFSQEVDSLIHKVNKSLSTYMPESDISRINAGDSTVIVDDMFKEVFRKSELIYEQTEGAFDPTIGILVNAWGFGPGKEINHLDKAKVDSLMQYVGFYKVRIAGDKVEKANKNIFLDFNANAKGYAVDVIGRFLESKNIGNYLVEIGGEIRVRGKNAKGKLWTVAIEKPNFDGSRSFQAVTELDNESIATSGNYRKFKIDPETGKRYAHTIDTQTGYPSRSDLLSASVIGHLDCADVDGYATAFMAMGLDKTKKFLEGHPELKAFLIYTNEKGEIDTYSTKNLKLVE